MKLVKGDRVLIIAGKDRGKEGVIEKVLPQKNKVVITGHNIIRKHMKRTAKAPQGGVVELFSPIDASNVALLDPRNNKPTRNRSAVPKPAHAVEAKKATKESNSK